MQRADAAGPSGPRATTAVAPEQVRDALAHLYDPGHLQTHPLAGLSARSAAAPSAGRALRQALLEAVDALRPDRGGVPNTKAARRHGILRLRYLEGRPVADIQTQLAIGRREYYREHAEAVEAVASLLGERLGQPGAGTADTPSEPTGTLPVYLTSFVGWEAESAEVVGLLAGTRLLTLTGAGGCGKTRLAVHAAADVRSGFPAGVWFVDLAPLADGALVPQAVLAALGLRQAPGRPPAAAVAAHLRGRAALAVLDNCEHLVEACAHLTEALLRGCPSLTVLATSREPLGLAGETVWRVPSLAAPGPGEAPTVEHLAAYPAVRLFADRAAAATGFALTEAAAAAVAQVCRRLDGIPLALELAAARTRVLAVGQIADRLDDRFGLLTAGSRTAPTRQQTLRATLDWSHALLTEREGVIFRRLGVFAGGFSLEAAETVCADAVPSRDPQTPTRGLPGVLDALAGLVDKSLVVAEEHGGEDRYRMLETVRAYALEQLGLREDAGARRARHAAYYLGLAARAEPALLGLARGTWRGWCDRVEREHDNLRAALRWYLDTGASEPGLSLAGALGQFWDFRGLLAEGCAWLDALLTQPGARATSARARALFWAGWLSHDEREDRLFAESLEAARACDDQRAVARALAALGRVYAARADGAAAGPLVEEGLAIGRRLGDVWSVFWCLLLRAWLAWFRGDNAAAHAGFAESRAFARDVGTWLIADTFEGEGLITLAEGDTAAAGAFYRQALAVFREWDVLPGVAHALQGVGLVALLEGDRPLARALLGECLVLQQRMGGDREGLPRTLRAVAALAATEGRPVRAVRLFGAADTLTTRILPLYLPYVSAARATLSGDAFATAWAEGRALTPEQAIAEAMGEAEPIPAAS